MVFEIGMELVQIMSTVLLPSSVALPASVFDPTLLEQFSSPRENRRTTRKKRRSSLRIDDGSASEESVITMHNSSDGSNRRSSHHLHHLTSGNGPRNIHHHQNTYTPFPTNARHATTGASGVRKQRVRSAAGTVGGDVFFDGDDALSSPAVTDEMSLQNQENVQRELNIRSSPAIAHHQPQPQTTGHSTYGTDLPSIVDTDGGDAGDVFEMSRVAAGDSNPEARLSVHVLSVDGQQRGGLCRSHSSSVFDSIITQQSNSSSPSLSSSRLRPVASATGHQSVLQCNSTPCSPSAVSDRPRPSPNYLYLYARLPKGSCDTDFERLTRTMLNLEEGGFYFKDMDSNSARALLQNSPEGSFLVRDSSDPKFLFSLSVKTARGPTSVRVEYYRGFFQLDCEDAMKRKLPRFETLLDLLDFHSAVSKDSTGGQYRWLESSRRKDMVMRLTHPHRHTAPTLSHLARLAVNRQLEDLHLPTRSTDLLPVPQKVKNYLREYPYKL